MYKIRDEFLNGYKMILNKTLKSIFKKTKFEKLNICLIKLIIIY